MQIFTNPQKLSAQCKAWRKAGDTLALVPTMGYYHKGHENLMAYGRKIADRLVVSLFVNPTQFGPNEDLEAYPRDMARDTAIAERHGVDAFFCPGPDAMYETNHATWVEVPELAKGLCGKSRPIHFRGVCTVVMKLFQIVHPDFAIFGQKDWQQQAIIRRMVRDLNLDVKIIALPTTREEDGLALSSRNVYMLPEERARAHWIRLGLLQARAMAAAGEKDVGKLRKAVLETWTKELPMGEVDYLAIVEPESLEPLASINGPALMACAVRVGKSRLIDNILLQE